MTAGDPTEGLSELERAAGGDPAAWQGLVRQHADRLRRMLLLRLDPRIRGRVDPSDVLQEAFLDAARGLAEYVRRPPLPFYLWLRQLAGTRLAKAHRRHLGAQARDARREVGLAGDRPPDVSSAVLAEGLLGREARPSEQAMRAELRARLEQALDRLGALDREVIALRHFEHLNNAEAACVLGLSVSAASKRYVRALGRLRDVLGEPSGEGRGGG